MRDESPLRDRGEKLVRALNSAVQRRQDGGQREPGRRLVGQPDDQLALGVEVADGRIGRDEAGQLEFSVADGLQQKLGQLVA